MKHQAARAAALACLCAATATACSTVDKAFNQYENITRVGEITSPEDMPNSIIMTKKGKLLIDLGGDNFKNFYDTASACSASTTESAEKQKCMNARNRIIGQWIYVADRACAYHLGAILGRANTTSVFLELASITTSGLATFLGGEQTRQALAAASTITSGANSVVRSEIYLGSITPLITKVIEDNRNKLGSDINRRMEEDTLKYPVDIALTELSQYHEACSFRKGVQLLANAAERPKMSKAEINAEIQEFETRRDELTNELKAYGSDLDENGNPNMERSIYNLLVENARTELTYVTVRLQGLRSNLVEAPDQPQE